MTDAHAGAIRFPWPPVVFVAAAAAAVLLHWLAPLPWLPRGPMREFLFGFGWLVAVGSLAIIATAVNAMRRAGTTVSPVKAAAHLVTAGPFSFTRNPIFLGAVTLLLGAGLITGIAWFFAFALAAGFAVQKLAIEPEERHLEARFGRRYRDYAKKVRRWI